VGDGQQDDGRRQAIRLRPETQPRKVRPQIGPLGRYPASQHLNRQQKLEPAKEQGPEVRASPDRHEAQHCTLGAPSHGRAVSDRSQNLGPFAESALAAEFQITLTDQALPR
jgi:hypothetical protein